MLQSMLSKTRNMKWLQKITKHTRESGCKILLRCVHTNLLSEHTTESFQNYLVQVIGNVVRKQKCLNTSDIKEKIQKASQYNINTANNLGSAPLLHAFNLLAKPEKMPTLTSKPLQEVFVLAWAIEMMHSHNLMLGNMESPQSLNASALLRSFIPIVLEEYFSQRTETYSDFLRLFNKAFLYNTLAGNISNAFPTSQEKYLDFTQHQYGLLCDYKTSYQSFSLPLLLAIKLADRSEESLCGSVEDICSELGKLYQMKKDFNNCFDGEDIIGTGGTDIQQGICTWLAVTALERATPRQRIVFTTCYGCIAPAHVERVKVLYKQLQLPRIFQERETCMVEGIKRKAHDLEAKGFPSDVFLKILDEVVLDGNVKAPEE